jgi:SET domain-containing protein
VTKVVVGNVYVAKSKIPQGGRGVFACRDIKKGELIESCPVIEIPQDEAEFVSQSVLITYIYYLGKNKMRPVLALGFGSIYNHSYTPNAKYKAKLNKKLIDFVAIKDIKQDEEITVNYNQASKTQTPLWFE